MDKFAWSYENEDSLIEMYKARPCLYDSNSMGFHNRNYKHKAREEIATALDVPVAVVTKHMESLRTQLCRLIKPLPSGVAQPRVTARQQWLLDSLDFLIPHMKKRNHRSKLCSSSELMLEADESNQSGEGEGGGDDSMTAEGIKFVSDLDDNDWPTPSYATNDMSAYRRPAIVGKPSITNHYVKKRRIDEDARTLDSPLISDVKPDTSIFLSKEIEEVDDDAVFGSHLVRQMRQITDISEKLKAQNKISNILFEARMRGLELQNMHSAQTSSCQSTEWRWQSSHSNIPACHCSTNSSNGHLSHVIDQQTDVTSCLSNDELKSKFQSLHNNIVNSVDPSSLIDYLFSHSIIDSKGFSELSSIADRKQQCRRFLVTLHNTNNPKTFILLRQAVKNDGDLEWLAGLIDGPNSETSGYRERPQILGRLTVPNDDEVAGIARADGSYVVVRANSDSLWVFDGLPPFCRRDDIRIDGLQNPVDAASCEKTGKLYIAESNCDKEQSCVWRVGIKSSKADRFIFVNFQPTALSVGYGRIVVTAGDLAKIFVFSAENGRQLKQIKLQSHVSPWHAVETPRGSYIVCQPSEDQVVEVDAVDGNVVKKFGRREVDDEQFAADGMLRAALDRVSGHSFVVDPILNRVVLVDSNLSFERVVLGKVDELKAPRLLFYSSESGMLAVSGDSGTFVFAMK